LHTALSDGALLSGGGFGEGFLGAEAWLRQWTFGQIMGVVSETALEKPGTGFTLFLCIAFILFPRCSSVAQIVATKDLVNLSPKDTSVKHVPSPPPDNGRNADNCAEAVVGIRDGEIVKAIPEKLQLEIVNVEPNVFYDGTAILVTVRLKNRGDQAILVPWDIPPVQHDVDPKTGNESWEVAIIGLKMNSMEDPQKFRILKTEATLAASPSNPAQHLALRPGEWAEIKFKANIECFSPESWACETLPSGGHTQIQARWSEELSTHGVNGCEQWSGHYASTAAESPPFEIVYVTSFKSEEAIIPKQ